MKACLGDTFVIPPVPSLTHIPLFLWIVRSPDDVVESVLTSVSLQESGIKGILFKPSTKLIIKACARDIFFLTYSYPHPASPM